MGKSSSKTTTTYGNTTTKNPYATAHTDNSGTTTKLNDGTALSSVYNFLNSNIDSLLNNYLNPKLDSDVNKAKIDAYSTNLNNQSRRALENNIINPLSNRNMIRSSQATDLYRNLSNSTTDAIASFINQLLTESQANNADILTNLMNLYLQGYNVAAGTQAQSLNTSSGNATRTTTSSPSTLDTVLKATSGALNAANQYKNLLSGKGNT